MTEQLTVAQTAERLQKKDRILIICHKNPDGDTIGSGTALQKALSALGKQAAILCSDPIPQMFEFMQPVVFDDSWVPEYVVAVDVAGIQLFGDKAQSYVEKIDLCIDHHSTNSGYADATLLDGDAAAAAEIVLQVVREMDVTFDRDLAACLYTGIATDTGCFKFANTTAKTHRLAADLIDMGLEVDALNAALFESKSRGMVAAERMIHENLEYYFNGRCALTYLTRDEIEASGAAPAELEEITGFARSIQGVDVGVTLRQNINGSYRVSLRTSAKADASAIARSLGGGGHARAAGCELMGNLDNTKTAILAEVERELARHNQDVGTREPS